MLQSHQSPLHIGAVTLIAKDAPRLGEFYQKIIGLDIVDRHEGRMSLGSGGEAYLHLIHSPKTALESPRSAGLFHTAFLLPSRASLGRWFTGAHGRGAEFSGASDHGVSEAFYLDDPEGNGIEVYADRPRGEWPRRAGGVNMTTERMDVDGVVSAGRSAPIVDGFPPQARIGHVHLRVGDINAVRSFYVDQIGLQEMDRRPGGVFYSAGGYHHHIATNQWQSAGAPARPAGTTGLAEVEIRVTEPAAMSILRTKAPAQADGTIALRDPAGITFKVRSG